MPIAITEGIITSVGAFGLWQYHMWCTRNKGLHVDGYIVTSTKAPPYILRALHLPIFLGGGVGRAGCN